MTTPIYPRSPRETMDGWVHLPRLIDKIRLHLAGRLPADYQPNYLHKGFDLAWFEASGVKPDAFVEVVRQTITDGEVCDWVKRNVRKTDAEKRAYNEGLLNYGRDTEERIARLKMRKEQAGWAQRDDLRCMFDFIDADEGRV